MGNKRRKGKGSEACLRRKSRRSGTRRRTQDLWSPHGPDERNWITSYEFVENDSDLVCGLLEVEGLLWDPHKQETIGGWIDRLRLLRR